MKFFLKRYAGDSAEIRQRVVISVLLSVVICLFLLGIFISEFVSGAYEPVRAGIMLSTLILMLIPLIPVQAGKQRIAAFAQLTVLQLFFFFWTLLSSIDPSGIQHQYASYAFFLMLAGLGATGGGNFLYVLIAMNFIGYGLVYYLKVYSADGGFLPMHLILFIEVMVMYFISMLLQKGV